MLRPLVGVALLAVGLAGCAGPATGGFEAASGAAPAEAFVPPVPDFDFSTVVDPDHPTHAVPSFHTAGRGLDLVGHAAIQPALPKDVRGSITQVDVWGDWAVVSGMEGGLGFALVDISDPAAPEVVSWFRAAADGWTARFSDDGNFVFYGCQLLGPPYVTSSGFLLGDCEDPARPHPPGQKGGVVAVDVSDKLNPVFVDFVPTTRAHNLQTANIGGVDWIFTDGVDVVRFDRDVGELTVAAAVPGRHDATVARHPLTGDWLLYTGTKELAIYDVNDPASPTPVHQGGLKDAEGNAIVGWHEQTVVPGVVDGRVVVAVGGETSRSVTGGVPDVLSFVDVTDPANPALLAQWSPPFQPIAPWLQYMYSIHEIAATPTGQVAVAWYHAGVWVLDVSTQERQAEPVVLAAYQPHEKATATPSTFPQTPVPVVPFVWGVNWDDRGYLVVPDMHTGLYVLEPEWGLVPGVDGGQ